MADITVKANTGRKAVTVSGILSQIYLIGLSAFMAFPILWSFLTSIKHESIVRKYPPEIIPQNSTWATIIERSPSSRSLAISAIRFSML